MLTVYKINRGVGRPLEFQGLKAPYFGRFIAIWIGMVTMWGVMHVVGFPSFIAALLALVPGGFGVRWLYRMSNRYGEYGLMKKSARRNLPDALVSPSRKVFINLCKYGQL